MILDFGGITTLLVDGLTLTLKSTTDWYWTDNGEKIPFEIPFITGEPNNYQNLNKNCLALEDTFLPYRFFDFPCIKSTNILEFPPLCQKKL